MTRMPSMTHVAISLRPEPKNRIWKSSWADACAWASTWEGLVFTFWEKLPKNSAATPRTLNMTRAALSHDSVSCTAARMRTLGSAGDLLSNTGRTIRPQGGQQERLVRQERQRGKRDASNSRPGVKRGSYASATDRVGHAGWPVEDLVDVWIQGADANCEGGYPRVGAQNVLLVIKLTEQPSSDQRHCTRVCRIDKVHGRPRSLKDVEVKNYPSKYAP